MVSLGIHKSGDISYGSSSNVSSAIRNISNKVRNLSSGVQNLSYSSSNPPVIHFIQKILPIIKKFMFYLHHTFT